MSEAFWAAAISRLDGSPDDGIHLLWTPPFGAGYSVRGFDIQRRASRPRQELVCAALTGAELDVLHRRFWLEHTLATISVNRTACPGWPEHLPDEPHTDRTPEVGGQICVEFGALKEGLYANPLVEQGLRFTTLDATGAASANSRVVRAGAEIRLDCGFGLVIDLPAPSDEVTVTLLHMSRPAKAAAFNRAGTLVASAGMGAAQNTWDTLELTGPGITRVVIDAPADETFLLACCYTVGPVRCVDFRQMRPGADRNPRVEQNVAFEVLDASGRPERATHVRTFRGITGLDCGAATRITFGRAESVELVVLALDGDVIVEAYARDARVDRAAITAAPHPQSLTLRGRDLAHVRIRGAQGAKVVLLSVCASTPRRATALERLEGLRLRQITGAASGSGNAAAVLRAASEGCLRYRIAFRATHRRVLIEIGVTAVLAIARREGNSVAVRQASDPSGLQSVTITGVAVDEVFLYVPHHARSLRICVDPAADRSREEAEWDREAFIARGIQIPARSVNGALASPADEFALASSRILAGEALPQDRFEDVAAFLNDAASNVAVVSPVLRTARTRDRVEDPFVELRPWAYALALLGHPAWRRALGFGFFDAGSGLVPGDVYDYRVIGYFRRRDLEETVLGFHTVPANTALPQAFQLGVVRMATRLPAAVEMFPAAAPSPVRERGRKGVRLTAGQRLTLSFPTPIARLVLELEPIAGHGLRYRARTTDFIPGLSGTFFDAAVPALRRVTIDFPEAVDTVELRGPGFLYAIRFAASGDPDDIIRASVVIPGVRYEPTAAPSPPMFLGTMNLQQPSLPGDPAVTTRTPPASLGFLLSWLPPPPSGSALTPWPPDIDSAPPFDVLGFLLERRRVDVATPFEPIDDDPEPVLYVGNRGSRSEAPTLSYGVDLLGAFPEVPRPAPPVSPLMTADDVLITAETPGPPPGSLHQYRIRSMDVLGRTSTARTGSVVRLEKRRAPPQPVAPETPAPPDVILPPGVRARALVAGDPELTAADRALLGASANAIVIEWGWTQQERDRDPFATEFRVYWQPAPPDIIAVALTGTAALAGGQWSMSAVFDRAVSANAMQGRFVRTGGRPFRVASHDGGIAVTMRFEPSAVEASAMPVAGRFEFRPKLDGAELRPGAWAERVSVVPVTAGAPAPFVLRDRMVLDPAHPRARVWVGVSAADRQAYIPDEIPSARPNGGRPGNESSVAGVVVEARYLGRPAFVVPPPLPHVPESVTREPAGESVTHGIDLPTLLPAVAIPPGHRVVVERVSVDALMTLVSARGDDRIGMTFPDGATTSYVLPNPGDQTAFLEQIRGGMATRVEGRFAMDVLLRFGAQLEPLWRRALPQPVAWGPVTDELPAKPERHIHRVRLVDPAGHVSSGAGIVPQIVRVASLRAPRAPEITAVGEVSDAIAVTATVTDMPDLRWVVFFQHVVDAAAALDERTLAKAQLLRLPDRRDLYPDDGLRLRLADGTLLGPAASLDIGTGMLEPPNRIVSGSLTVGFDRRVAVWALTMTRDGIPSRFAGPRVAMTGPAPLVVPALGVAAGPEADEATWGAVSPPADVAIERSVDAGATWTRVSPWLPPSTVSYSVSRGGGAARLYRLTLRASRNRSAVGTAAAPT